MKHPEIVAVPVLMLADYALTILGAKSSAAVYRKHFAMASYELNPLWRRSVDQIRWFNPRHLALVVLVTGMLIVVDQRTSLSRHAIEISLGMLFGAFGSVCGRHLSNLMVFRYLNRCPNEISGQVRMSMRLGLKISQFTYIGMIPLFTIIVSVAPNAYTFGVLLGLLTVVFVHAVWARKAESVKAEPSAGGMVEEPVEEEA